MRLQQLHVKNFRGLEDISIEFEPQKLVNVIVGPNAIGKTTVLEAIRLAKGLLAPRTPGEPTQVLTALGAASPHLPQRVFLEALARDISKPVEIRTDYSITQDELAFAEGLLPQLALQILQSKLGLAPQGPLAMVQFLSSPQGKDLYEEAQKQVIEGFHKMKAAQSYKLSLVIDPAQGTVRGEDGLAQALIAFLDNQQPTYQTLFSYFPADRAMPTGDTAIQIGPHDISAQLESHNSQPHTKYNRLKTTIFNTILQRTTHSGELTEAFDRIFNALLKGRKFDEVGINELGLTVFQVQDTKTGRKFSVDGMSSGEKALILTFLLIGRSLSKGGIILLDEPELHLNPAVCKLVLPFLVEEYCKPKQLQAIICTHSAEILAGAFESEDCALYHLLSSTLISRVQRNDREEVSGALRILGTSETEELLYKGTMFVEGAHDVALLEEGFSSILGRYNLKDLGGRREVEKQIVELQRAEQVGTVDTPRYFLFDRDNAPTNLTSSTYVKVLQWKRRCFENYLLDKDAVFQVCHDVENVKNRLEHRGEAEQLLRQLAMSQLADTVVRDVYGGLGYKSPGATLTELEQVGVKGAPELLYGRIQEVCEQLKELKRDQWIEEFRHKCDDEIERRTPLWEQDWIALCDGKRLIHDLHRNRAAKMSLLMLKKRLLAAMQAAETKGPSLREVEELLREMLG